MNKFVVVKVVVNESRRHIKNENIMFDGHLVYTWDTVRMGIRTDTIKSFEETSMYYMSDEVYQDYASKLVDVLQFERNRGIKKLQTLYEKGDVYELNRVFRDKIFEVPMCNIRFDNGSLYTAICSFDDMVDMVNDNDLNCDATCVI